LLLGKEKFEGVDIRVRVKGGGHVARIYGKTTGTQDDFTSADFDCCFLNAAIRQAISKALVAYYQKCECASAQL